YKPQPTVKARLPSGGWCAMTFCKKMTPAQESKMFTRGCLIVFVALVITGGLAYFVDSRFGIFTAAIVIFWVAVGVFKSKMETKRIDSAFNQAFGSFQGTHPELKRTNSYGYPFFTVHFGTKEEMIRAFESGHLDAFRAAIARLHDFDGFDIEKGFDETYVGWEADYTAAMTDDPNRNPWFDEKLRLRELHYSSSPNQKEAEQVGDGDAEEAV
ncbi:hypothetical protein ACFSSA_08815, partial [Luteolibacter algae]